MIGGGNGYVVHFDTNHIYNNDLGGLHTCSNAHMYVHDHDVIATRDIKPPKDTINSRHQTMYISLLAAPFADLGSA